MATRLYKTVKPAGGDYTSLAACLIANQQNLVTADKYFDVEIDGDWSGGADTTAVTIDSWTTDETHYINIYTTAAARYKGVYSTSYYRLEPTATTGNTFNIYYGWVTINGIQVTHAQPSGNNVNWMYFNYAVSGSKTWVLNSIFKLGGTSSSNTIQGFYQHDANHSVIVANCIIYDFLTSANNNYVTVFYIDAAGTMYLYNNTVVDCVRHIDIQGAGAVVSKNSGASNMTYANIGSPTETTCSASTPTFADAAADNFHLGSADTTWHDAGTDLSGDAVYPFSTDIDGDTRVAWDIGADELIVAAAGSIKNINGVVWADIKSIHGRPVSEIKNINGVATQ
jgi:hypothetical protein